MVMNESVQKLKLLGESFAVSKLASRVLDNPSFGAWVGSSKADSHHNYEGGLADHVLDVVELCLDTHKRYQLPYTTEKDIFLAGLYHDYGKLWDYGRATTRPAAIGLETVITSMAGEELYDTLMSTGSWVNTEHRYAVHHISRSMIEFTIACGQFTEECSSINRDAIVHAILSHHGQPDWGSPVQPRTYLAWILHLCDSISARVNECKQLGGRPRRR